MKMVGPNSNVKGVFQGSSRGFTMIEVLIAIAILGISSIGFLGALATTSLSVGRADERTVAESLARKQMEYVKNQVYQAAPTNGIATYQKISGIPGNYTIWSVNRAGTVVPDIVGIPWDSENSKPLNQTAKDIGLQKISLVIMHEGEVIFSFVNKNPVWAYNATITLEGYKVER